MKNVIVTTPRATGKIQNSRRRAILRTDMGFHPPESSPLLAPMTCRRRRPHGTRTTSARSKLQQIVAEMLVAVGLAHEPALLQRWHQPVGNHRDVAARKLPAQHEAVATDLLHPLFLLPRSK